MPTCTFVIDESNVVRHSAMGSLTYSTDHRDTSLLSINRSEKERWHADTFSLLERPTITLLDSWVLGERLRAT